MIEIFNRLTRRETIMVTVMALCLFFAGAYFLFILPLQQAHLAAENTLVQAQQRYSRVASKLASIDAAAMTPAPKGLSPENRTPDRLRAQILSVSQQQGFSLSSLKTEAGLGITVLMDKTQSPALFAWLETLKKDHAITVTRLSVQKNPDQKSLRVQAVLDWAGQ